MRILKLVTIAVLFFLILILSNCKNDDIYNEKIYHNVQQDANYSPDGKKLILSIIINTKDSIIEYNLIEKTIRLLVFDNKNYYFHPIYSPDGKKIVFTKSFAGIKRSELFLMDSNGENIEQLTNDNVQAGNFMFTPDGKTIFFQERSDENLFFTFFKLDLKTKSISKVSKNSFRDIFGLSMDSEGKYLMFSEFVDDYADYGMENMKMILLDLATGIDKTVIYNKKLLLPFHMENNLIYFEGCDFSSEQDKKNQYPTPEREYGIFSFDLLTNKMKYLYKATYFDNLPLCFSPDKEKILIFNPIGELEEYNIKENKTEIITIEDTNNVLRIGRAHV